MRSLVFHRDALPVISFLTWDFLVYPGEDPFLTGEYVMQFSYHMQHGPDQKYLRVLSTAKHFLDYDQEGSPYGVMRGDFDAIVTDQDQ